jgi:hypothetical protein
MRESATDFEATAPSALSLGKQDTMNIPTINENEFVNDYGRARYRSALRSAITNWRSAGSPRDAVTVAQVIEARTALTNMTPDHDAERDTIAHTLAMVDEVAASLADGDANANATPEFVAGEDLHRECEAKLTQLAETVTRLSQPIEADDHRLTDLWERAGEIADRRGYCSVYDELAEELGAPTRSVSGEVVVEVTRSQTFRIVLDFEGVSASDMANDWRGALESELGDSYTMSNAIDCADPEDESIEWEFRSYERS